LTAAFGSRKSRSGKTTSHLFDWRRPEASAGSNRFPWPNNWPSLSNRVVDLSKWMAAWQVLPKESCLAEPLSKLTGAEVVLSHAAVAPLTTFSITYLKEGFNER
jgi:hypothetical protein